MYIWENSNGRVRNVPSECQASHEARNRKLQSVPNMNNRSDPSRIGVVVSIHWMKKAYTSRPPQERFHQTLIISMTLV